MPLVIGLGIYHLELLLLRYCHPDLSLMKLHACDPSVVNQNSDSCHDAYHVKKRQC